MISMITERRRGTRLWPVSRKNRRARYLALAPAEDTLYSKTVHRARMLPHATAPSSFPALTIWLP